MDENCDIDNNERTKKQTRCFVCDADVMGRFYALATCRTQNTQTRVIEKLGELVGKGYMLVISEDDVICRSCGILVNTFDRLEMELHKVRSHILRFLEQKYSLKEGELRSNDDKPKPCQPPQITKSEVKGITCDKSSNKTDSDPGNKKTLSKFCNMLQCDKCKYTTRLNSFMVHHLKDHMKINGPCDSYENVILEDTKHNCSKTNDLENKENESGNSGIIIENKAIKPIFSKQTQILPITQVVPITQIIPVTQTTPPPLIGLSNFTHLHSCSSMASQEPMYVLQSINIADIDNSKKMTKLDSNPVQKTQVKDKGTKQMLTMKDDGSILLVKMPVSCVSSLNETEEPSNNLLALE